MSLLDITKLSEEELLELWNKDGVLKKDDQVYTVDIVEESQWVDDYKYSFCTIVIKYNDKFYQFSFARTGSYYSYYETQANGPAVEVKKVKKIVEIEEWEEV